MGLVMLDEVQNSSEGQHALYNPIFVNIYHVLNVNMYVKNVWNLHPLIVVVALHIPKWFFSF